EALAALKPGQCVKILDRGPYREALDVSLPEDVGLISEAGARLEPPAWVPNGPKEEDPKKRYYNALVLRCPRGVRLSGLEIASPPLPDTGIAAHLLTVAGGGDLVIEGCRFQMALAPAPGEAPIPFPYGLSVPPNGVPGSCRVFVRESSLEGGADLQDSPGL